MKCAIFFEVKWPSVRGKQQYGHRDAPSTSEYRASKLVSKFVPSVIFSSLDN